MSRRGSRAARELRRVARWLLLAAVALIAVLAIEALVAILTVPDDGYLPPSPAPRSFGTGPPALRYVVLGDSTATGQGAPYERAIAVQTARHLTARGPLTLTNLAVSGALLGDVTALTRLSSVRAHLRQIADELRAARCDVAIVVTGSPDVGSAPRLAQPLRSVAGWRTAQVNGAVADVVRDRGLVLAPLARRTGQLFRADRSLFAADGYHPSAAGYATWVTVIAPALDRALGQRDTVRPCRSAAASPRRR